MLIEILENFDYVHWLSIGVIFLLGELLLTSTFLLWLGIASFICALCTFLFEMPHNAQFICFGIASVIGLFIARRFRNKTVQDNVDCSEKHSKLVGYNVIVQQGMIFDNKIKLDGTLWAYISSDEVKVGDKVTVEAVEGNKLVINISK